MDSVQETAELLRTSDQCQKMGHLQPGVTVVDSEFIFRAFPARHHAIARLCFSGLSQGNCDVYCETSENISVYGEEEMREP